MTTHRLAVFITNHAFEIAVLALTGPAVFAACGILNAVWGAAS